MSPPGSHGEVVDPLRDPRWGAFVDRAPGATIFHHPAWVRLIHRRYRYPVAACVAVDPGGAIVAGLPVALAGIPRLGRRLVAFPFSDACPPLGAPAGMAAVAAVVEGQQARFGAPVEIRGPLAARGAHEGARFCHHVLALGDLAAVERGFTRSSVLRGVRRARREGLVAERRTDVAALDAFFALHVVNRSRLGAPTQPRSFIRDLAGLFADGLGFVMLVTREGRPAAAAVFLHHGTVLTYKYGASDPAALRMRPNNLLFWEAIAWGCDHGMEQLDLGRSELGQQSLREFKRSWGADERILAYTHLGPGAAREADRGMLGRALAEGLRRTPPVASRMAGELLYRFAG